MIVNQNTIDCAFRKGRVGYRIWIPIPKDDRRLTHLIIVGSGCVAFDSGNTYSLGCV